MQKREKVMVTGAVAAVTIGVGLVFVVSRYRHEILKRLRSLVKQEPLSRQKIHIVTTADDCKKVISNLKRDCLEYKVLGFDCEWVTEQGKRRPVALLQLTSHQGLCALIRLCKMREIPKELYDLLGDEAIVKVGVGIHEDARLLRLDYNMQVVKALDLRYMAESARAVPRGIGAMAKNMLGITLDKSWRISCSNWEAPVLSEVQIKYAASDAHVAVMLFDTFAKKISPHYPWTRRKAALQQSLDKFYCNMDMPYKQSKHSTTSGKSNKLLEVKSFQKNSSRSMTSISKPLYDNCVLEAPNGETLCTINQKKAQWYLSKDLASVVRENPLTVRLQFEPARRGTGTEALYYKAKKENKCVVCGAEDSFNRKHVIPKEYRKHYPVPMKSRASHDVVLLCSSCHQKSNYADNAMRLKLSTLCQAPLPSQPNGMKHFRDQKQSLKVKAAHALQRSGNIPPERRQQLESIVLNDMPENTELTQELLQEISNTKALVLNEDFCPHGELVVSHFLQQSPSGLLELLKIWRQHFLDTMRPNHLPAYWSVEHDLGKFSDLIESGNSTLEKDRSITETTANSNSTLTVDRAPGSNEDTLTSLSSTATAFYSADNSQTLYNSAVAPPSLLQVRSIVTDFQTIDATDDISELATEKDFASVQLNYDSDDTDSTLSQPSSTINDSTGLEDEEDVSLSASFQYVVSPLTKSDLKG